MRITYIDDAPTAPVTLPGGHPRVSTGAHRVGAPRRSRRLLVVAVALAVVVLGGAVAAYLVLDRPAPEPVIPVSIAGSTLPAGLPAVPRPVPATSSAHSATHGCPTPSELVAEYRRHGTSPTRSGATARGPATCAGGFAVMKLRSPGDSETVTAIFAIGPPVTFREAGTGPICTDDPAALPGATVVPHAGAATLGCVTGEPTPTPAARVVAGPVPTLGRPQEPGSGYGEVRPSTIDNQGDISSSIHGIRWQSWGGQRAVGTGTAWYADPSGTTAGGQDEQATVVAFDLRTCAGKPAYMKVQWYFPQHGGSLKVATATDTCS